MGLTGLGVQAATQLAESWQSRGRDQVVLVECFAGIGGARRAFELLGVEVAVHVAIESDDQAVRVLKAAWPDVIHYPDVRAFGLDELREIASRHTGIAFGLT